jgi:hypothetical protein
MICYCVGTELLVTAANSVTSDGIRVSKFFETVADKGKAKCTEGLLLHFSS